MDDITFAFESSEVSIALMPMGGMGDMIIAKKVFDVIVKLVPNSKIDIFCSSERNKTYVKAFYGGNQNLNFVSNNRNIYARNAKKYDLALYIGHVILIDTVNEEKLENKSPELFQSVQKIKRYNQIGFDKLKTFEGMVLFNISRAHILGINRYTCLSCGGALPIHDNHVEIPLSSEGDRQFQELGLGKKYITVGSNLGKQKNPIRYTLKEWPTAYVTEYISLLNINLPQVEVVQVGGGGVEIFKNADRHIIDADLELVKHILKNSLLHVDCESGLVHLATQLGTKCLVLFGPTDEKYYGFKENLNLISNFCRPCVYAWNDGLNCLRGATEPLCMLSITPQIVCDVTCNYINHIEQKNNT